MPSQICLNDYALFILRFKNIFPKTLTSKIALNKISEMLSQAIALHKSGLFTEAQALYETILVSNALHFDAMHLLGVIALQFNQPERAVNLISRAITIFPYSPESFNNIGLAYQRLQQFDQALANYDQAITLNNRYAEAYLNRGNALQALNRANEAYDSYSKAIELIPDYAEAFYNSGNLLKDANRLDEALLNYDYAIKIRPDFTQAYGNRGIVLRGLDRAQEALMSYERAIALDPSYIDAHVNRGVVQYELKHFEAARVSYLRAIALNPDSAQAYSNLGILCNELKQFNDALNCYKKALLIKPDFAEAHHNCGVTLFELRRFREALEQYDQAILYKNDYLDALVNRGNTLKELGVFDEALNSYNTAIAFNPNFVEALSNRGSLQYELRQYKAASESYELAYQLAPDQDYLLGYKLLVKIHTCDWTNLQAEINLLKSNLINGFKAITPFTLLALSDSPSLHLSAARVWAHDKHPIIHELEPFARQVAKNKIRIAYYSADFHFHPVALLLVGVFEHHNQHDYEFIAFSYGPQTDDEMRNRISNAFTEFYDVKDWTDRQVAEYSRHIGIDIAVDLTGYTKNGRSGIFAYRAAPLQVNFLGYPGTLGAEYIDYIIADQTIIPFENQKFFSEKIIYLPDTFLPNDSKKIISDCNFSRSDLGLPENAFVFCCFNNNYKIQTANFASWMRILDKVPDSVLWLLSDHHDTRENLKREACSHGISEDRLIFCQRTPLLSDHLARYRFADLFLDTLPFNAITTASDSLWAGLPVLTCIGQSFVSRVAASLLYAVGLPELVTDSVEAYEALAIDFALQPLKLEHIKNKLQKNLLTMPLFDTRQYTLHIESAYSQIYKRYISGLAPDHLYIESCNVID
jgi:predicted O-linked N-acetylglucosamine transferase (SPINDLY family)